MIGQKINDDVTALKDQINSVVGGGAVQRPESDRPATLSSASILASLDRDSNGNVTASSITVNGQNLSTGSYVANDVFGSSTNASANGDTVAFTLDGGGGTGDIVIDDTAADRFRCR